MIVNVHDAKTHFSRYFEKVEKGDEIIIGKYGKPVAKLIGLPQPKPRKPGALRDSLWINKDFDKMPKEWLESICKV